MEYSTPMRLTLRSLIPMQMGLTTILTIVHATPMEPMRIIKLTTTGMMRVTLVRLVTLSLRMTRSTPTRIYRLAVMSLRMT
jgi:hypothetical protein